MRTNKAPLIGQPEDFRRLEQRGVNPHNTQKWDLEHDLPYMLWIDAFNNLCSWYVRLTDTTLSDDYFYGDLQDHLNRVSSDPDQTDKLYDINLLLNNIDSLASYFYDELQGLDGSPDNPVVDPRSGARLNDILSAIEICLEDMLRTVSGNMNPVYQYQSLYKIYINLRRLLDQQDYRYLQPLIMPQDWNDRHDLLMSTKEQVGSKSTKHNLSLNRLAFAYNRLYDAVTRANGRYVNWMILGLNKFDINALVEEGLAMSNGGNATLTRIGYEKPQWYNYNV